MFHKIGFDISFIFGFFGGKLSSVFGGFVDIFSDQRHFSRYF
jgi:hypothetical protein